MIPVVISKCCATVGTYAAAPIHWKKNVRYVKEELHCAMEYQYSKSLWKSSGRLKSEDKGRDPAHSRFSADGSLHNTSFAACVCFDMRF